MWVYLRNLKKKKENEGERDGGGFSSKVKVVSGKVSPCFYK